MVSMAKSKEKKGSGSLLNQKPQGRICPEIEGIPQEYVSDMLKK